MKWLPQHANKRLSFGKLFLKIMASKVYTRFKTNESLLNVRIIKNIPI